MDNQFIRESLKIAKTSVANGNHPFGALLVDENDIIICVAENTQITDMDCTSHAELNLVSKVSKLKLSKEKLAMCTLYTSTEPCAMCAGAIAWLKIGKVVYGCSSIEMSKITGGGSFKMPCQTVFSYSTNPIPVVGPILEEECKIVHQEFWSNYKK